jgi:outer membrane protein OmpA-like peptidoglycan-associated protein
MKNDVKLTSVNIIKDVYFEFKKNSIDSDITLQKVVNRVLDLYNKNPQVKELINNHETLDIKNSKY